MKENKRKIALVSIGILLILGIVIGISYAFWMYTITQESTNVVKTDCFKIEFTDQNAINLNKAYPISDEKGLETTPYTFTITNVCDSSASYQVNLETMPITEKKLPDKYLKVNLQEGTKNKITTKLDKESNSELNTNTTIEKAIEAYKLATGILGPNEIKEYNLRIWMDEDVEATEDSMNAFYSGKISINATYYEDERGTLRAASGVDDTTAFYQYRSDITKVVFEDTLNPKETELSWDVSEAQDGSVMSYLIPNEEDTSKYTLYIQSKGGVKANPDSNYLFKGFTNLITIEGLELLDTSQVMKMGYMFYGCNSLTNLDLSGFDTSKVTFMGYMFSSCNSLTDLDLSSFDTGKVTNMNSMFLGCRSLVSLDLSNFGISQVISQNSMFYIASSTAIIKVKDEATQSWVLNTTNCPSSWTTENVIIAS